MEGLLEEGRPEDPRNGLYPLRLPCRVAVEGRGGRAGPRELRGGGGGGGSNDSSGPIASPSVARIRPPARSAPLRRQARRGLRTRTVQEEAALLVLQ